MNFEQEAQHFDEQDELSHLRDRFLIPKDKVYLCGNSLGLQPRGTKQRIEEELSVWSSLAVDGHFEEFNAQRPWVVADEFVHKSSAQLVGALPSEVAIMNSLTVNLHLLLVALYRPLGDNQTLLESSSDSNNSNSVACRRRKIIVEGGAFPSDRYALQSHAKLRGFECDDVIVEAKPRDGEETLRTEDVVALIKECGDELALVMMSGVQYYTGQLFDIAALTEAAHAVGAMAVFDLAHAVGNVPLKLHEWNVDGACWCTYKYLNSGPGNIGGFFLHERHAERRDFDRLAGWWGHKLESRFDMRQPFDPIPGAFGYRLSNPPVICIAALLASLDVFDEAGGMEPLRAKSLRLTGFLERMLTECIGREHVRIITPIDAAQRGCQLSLHFADAEALTRIADALQAANIIVDVRKPNVVRISPTPLYNTFNDVYRFVDVLSACLQ